MAADYSKTLGLDTNLYKVDPNANPLTQISPADLETLFPDGTLPQSKVGTVGVGQLSGGTLPLGQSIIITDGSYRRGIFGFIGEST